MVAGAHPPEASRPSPEPQRHTLYLEHAMRQFMSAKVLALFSVAVLPLGVMAGETEDCLAVMKMMPADWPLAVVVTNFDRFNKSMKDLGKKLGSEGDDFDMLKDLKGEIGVGDVVDYTKPFALSAAEFGQSGMPVVWARVPDAAEKIKAMTSAKQDGDIWQFGPSEDKQYFVQINGEYVVVASNKEDLVKATKKDNRSLADELKSRSEIFAGRDLFLHLNIDPVRESALGGVAQIGQMGPMLGIMLAQQAGGMDPTMILGAISTVGSAAKELVEQISYVELGFIVDGEAARLTIATGYKDGAIKNYLTRTKPAAAPFFAEIEEQTYIFALGYHIPGGESPVIDYFLNQMKKGMTPTGGDAGAKSAADEGLALTKDLFSKIEGMNQIFSMSGAGMKAAGDYIGSDPSQILELNKKMLTTAGSLTKAMSGGISYEPAGNTKIGDVSVDRFTVKLDPASPAAQQAKGLVGEGLSYGVGVQGGRVRYCMGDQKDMEKAFAAKTAKPLGSSVGVKAALAKLPENRNGVMLIDPAGIIAAMGAAMGNPAAPAADGPGANPMAVSFSLSGHPARLDLYVPVKGIEQIVKGLSGSGPQ